jgi:hypothetical protein
MFNVNNQYKVKFEYGNVYGEKPDKYSPPVSCTCNIYSVDDVCQAYLIAFGTAYCAPTDNFSYPAGRKIALTKALKGFDREIRKAFWESYWKSGAKRE